MNMGVSRKKRRREKEKKRKKKKKEKKKKKRRRKEEEEEVFIVLAPFGESTFGAGPASRPREGQAARKHDFSDQK